MRAAGCSTARLPRSWRVRGGEPESPDLGGENVLKDSALTILAPGTCTVTVTSASTTDLNEASRDVSITVQAAEESN